MVSRIPGYGRKRPQLDISVKRLDSDPLNPRLPKDLRNKGQTEILAILKRYFDLDELAYSMAENGYFDEEPLVAVPIDLPAVYASQDSHSLTENAEYRDYLYEETTRFTVIEGNRRLATVKILLSTALRTELRAIGWPTISEEVREDLSVLPVIVYPQRQEVLRYMGVRHVTGIKKWGAYSKALYIAEMVGDGSQINDIRQMVGDRSNSVRKLYLSYRLIEEAENELQLDTVRAKDYFSYLILALGQGAVKEFLGIPESFTEVNFSKPIRKDKLDNLKHLFSWLFGEGKDKLSVLKESRDITNYLTPVLRSEEATQHLILTRDLLDAYERSDGEKNLLLRNLKKASKGLSNSLGLITKYKTDEDVKQEIANCLDILKDITKLIENKESTDV